MPRSRLDGPLGDRVGPKLADLFARYTLGTRRALGPLEARWRAAGTQITIDRAGAEIADHLRPFLEPLIAGEHGELHPVMRDYLARTAAGTHQWHTLGGMLFGLSSSALGQAISNAVAPVAYAINRSGPNLSLDPATAAAAAAAGLFGMGEAYRAGANQGYAADEINTLANLAQNIPQGELLGELVNRGLLTEEQADYWMHRAAAPEAIRHAILAARRRLLEPADAALGLLRGDIDTGRAEEIARMVGMEPGDLAVLVANTGEPPGPQQLAEALRRGFIDRDRFARGIRQSRIRNEWLDVEEALRFEPIPTADATDAWLRGFIGEELQQQIAEQNGTIPDQVPILRMAAGNPPSPEQLLELERRGYITADVVRQGLREGRLRDEWIPAIRNLEYQPLPVADVVDAWLRGHIGRDGAAEKTREAGLLPADFELALQNAGNPLPLMQLLEALRRGFIDRETFDKGFRESRYRDEWIDTALKVAYTPLSTADGMEALLQGWITRTDAVTIAHDNGLEPRYFDTAFKITGEPLNRTELQELYNRGELDLETYRQALRESRLRDNYIDLALKLHVRLPQPYQVVRFIEYGIATTEQGIKILMESGYSEQVAKWMVAEGAVTSMGPHKRLAAGEVTRLYAERIIDEPTARQMLAGLHYTTESATLMLRLASYEQKRRILESGIGMIRSHYVAHRTDAATARADLLALHLPSDAVDLYMQVWGYDRLAHPRQLSEAQIVKAAKLNLLVPQGNLSTAAWEDANQKAGAQRLVNLGYDDTDAGLLLAGA